ncbi:hypothetical protein SAMN04515654_10565 [Halanaerobium congolense]|uniref:BREX system P-loop protein BrxC n=1 Tax=Halanaerobium congolense TaxID=54121 RepID=A0A1G8K275_9FIRM|nr:BREX system P-loop protein BrxC [Halanaerobium congolense]SDI37499.1 hypothetical protein SAMN04515654_10565 [Halanaerobium congolense]SET03528.1 hypothetical protein SAMN04515653_10565 [Halanaerobium congolense]
MRIENMFKKDINREIRGVIKVAQNDEKIVENELEEYVVTNELEMHFQDFFEAYKKGIDDYTDKMGVWISGFFGSGKSHFLKILSYILDNREVKNKKAREFFNEKINDPMLLADMQRASEIPSDVILFNVDSKSDSDSKADKEAIVKVFMKVFNEHQGYCGSIPWLADLERRLDQENNFQNFKNEFADIAGDKWENKREDFYFEEEAIIEALVRSTKMNKESAKHWYETSEDNYSISIEKFATSVKEYIAEKEDNHHVLFLVDEIGQYIGDDGQLMLNLQTVAEDLGIHCGGKAWVMVTSQEELGKTVKRIKGMDFSKIIGRFDTRLNLSGANVDEVIKQRILAKNETAIDTLKLLYNDKSAVLKNIITFSEGTRFMENYKDAAEFAEVYPFVPYQFKLLQQVFEEIRRHGATGKHLSEGERSLLSAFQEAAQTITDSDEGEIIPFSTFYRPIESFLDSNIRRVIENAKSNDNLRDYDVEVLKLLFLIRYVNGVPANIENITTLLVSQIDEDKIELKKNIEESLRRLLKETLIQRNGEEYFFLTNEEQDINREINSMDVDNSKILKYVGDIIFEEIYTDKKYRYNKKYDFAFNQIIDEMNRGRQTEDIGIKILTPYYPAVDDRQLLLESSGENNIIVKMPDNTNFIDEIEQTLKIEKYLRKRSSQNKTNAYEDIISRIQRDQTNRKKRIQSLIEDNLGESKVFVRNSSPNIGTTDPVKKINESFRYLIESLYEKLHYINKHYESQSDLDDLINSDKLQLELGDKNNKLAYDEVKNYLDRKNKQNMRVSFKNLVDKFTSVPYGWRELDLAAVIIQLLKAKEINLQYNSENISLNNKDLTEYLTKKRHQEKLVIKKRVKVDQHLINNAKSLGRELFNKSTLHDDEDKLKEELEHLINNEYLSNIKYTLREYHEEKRYPGKKELESAQKLFNKIENIDDSYQFYKELDEQSEELKETGRKLDRIFGFFENQRKHFDRALETLRLYGKNKTYIENEKLINTAEELNSIVNSENPYGQIHSIPDLRDKFNKIFVGDILDQRSKPVKETIEADKEKVKSEFENRDYNFELYFRNRLLSRFDELLKKLDESNNINEIIAMPQESEVIKKKCFKEIDEKIKEFNKEKEGPETRGIAEGSGDGKVEPEEKQEKEIKNVTMNDLFKTTKAIENEDDIEEFLNDIRIELKKILDEDKNIKLI